MAGLRLDGKLLAQQIEQQLALWVQEMQTTTGGRVPTLATILVGDDPASATYVRMKGNACKRVGMQSLRIALAHQQYPGTIPGYRVFALPQECQQNLN